MANDSRPMFSIVPIDVCADYRLTLEQMRVLIALLSFRAKNTDCVWPKRQQISERCGGMHINNISAATAALEKLGWLEKVGRGGKSKPTEYRITVPDIPPPAVPTGGSGGLPRADTVALPATVAGQVTVAHQATVADAVTVAESASTTLADSARSTLADQARGNKQTIEQTIEQTRKEAGASAPHAHPGERKRKEAGGSAPVTFDTFAARCRTEGAMLIPDTDPVIDYAEGAGIDPQWLRAAWIEFKARYSGNAKRYTDWRATFRNAVRGNWFKLWRADNAGVLVLTTEGITAMRAMQSGDRKVSGGQEARA